jgi:hypothetical protein
MGASEDVPALRARWVLRFLEEQARDKAFSWNAASHHALDRAGRILEVVLCRRAYDGLRNPMRRTRCYAVFFCIFLLRSIAPGAVEAKPALQAAAEDG